MSVSKDKSEEWKKCVQLLYIDIGMAIFYLSRRGKKDYFMYVPWMDTMGAILLCQAVKPVGKQGPVINWKVMLMLFLCSWDSGSVDWGILQFECKTVRVSDDPCHFRQVFLCGPVIPPVKWVVTTGLLGSLLTKWSHRWAKYLQEKLLGTLTIPKVKRAFNFYFLRGSPRTMYCGEGGHGSHERLCSFGPFVLLVLRKRWDLFSFFPLSGGQSSPEV